MSREPSSASHEPRSGERVPQAPRLPDRVLAEIVQQAEAGYPEEICGIVIGRRGEPATYTVRQVKNIANEQRQRDTTGVERDARTAYFMDGVELVGVDREAEARGWQMILFYHSHPDHDAYFSAMDRDRALFGGREPLWPAACYLVISVRGWRAQDARCYLWDAATGDFTEHPVPLPARSSPPSG